MIGMAWGKWVGPRRDEFEWKRMNVIETEWVRPKSKGWG